MNLKDNLEINHWINCQNSFLPRFCNLIETCKKNDSVLEIGSGPIGGYLPLLKAHRKVGLDPLVDKFREENLLVEDIGIEYVNEYFENWVTEEKFDSIISVNSLDHGEMGFHLLPKVYSLLKEGGHFYLWVHLREENQLNKGHDHSLTLEDFDKHKGEFKEVKKKIENNQVKELQIILKK